MGQAAAANTCCLGALELPESTKSIPCDGVVGANLSGTMLSQDTW